MNCNHPVIFHGLCAVCGSEVQDLELTETIAMLPTHREIQVTRQEAEKMEQETAERLLREQKLSLILDLDQTVLHASINQGIESYIEAHGNSMEVHHFTLADNFQFKYFIKLRPGLREFLLEMQNYYEFHIYTMGTRRYAEACKQIIDPKNTLFKERILTRDESGSHTAKDIRNIFPCDSSMVLILDDRNDVWNWSRNLIRVSPYSFFYGTEDINAPVKQDQQPKDEKDLLPPAVEPQLNLNQKSSHVSPQKIPFPDIDNDSELIQLSQVLKDIHKKYYSSSDNKLNKLNDASQILTLMKQSIFQKIVVCFSSVFPTTMTDGSIVDQSQFHDWKWISSFGATLLQTLDLNKITHLVALKPNTAKVDQVRNFNSQGSSKRKIWIVTPQFLFQSMQQWKKLDENKFLLIQGDPLCIGTPLNDPILNVPAIIDKNTSDIQDQESNIQVDDLDNLDEYVLDQDALFDIEAELMDELQDIESETESQPIAVKELKTIEYNFSQEFHQEEKNNLDYNSSEIDMLPQRKKQRTRSQSPLKNEITRSRSKSPKRRKH